MICHIPNINFLYVDSTFTTALDLIDSALLTLERGL
jgi:hypothetical protein